MLQVGIDSETIIKQMIINNITEDLITLFDSDYTIKEQKKSLIATQNQCLQDPDCNNISWKENKVYISKNFFT